MTIARYCRALTIATTGLAWAAVATAQVRVEAGPVVGLYAPLGSFDPAAYYSTGLPSTPNDLTGLALGAQGRLWLGRRFGVQLDGSVARTRVGGGSTPGGFVSTRAARVFNGAAQVLYNLVPTSGARRLWLSAGAGLVRHGGEAYNSYRGLRHFAGVIGFGSTIPLTPQFSLNAGLSALLYGMSIRDNLGVSVEHGTQVDARLQTGITWHWR